MLDTRDKDEPVETVGTGKLQYTSFGRFRMDARGLHARPARGKQDSEEATSIWVSAPFKVLGRARAADGTEWGKQVEFSNYDGVSRTCFVSDAALHSDPRKLAAMLADQGLKIARGRSSDLADYLNQCDPPDRITRVAQTGWHSVGGETCFVLPTHTIGPPSKGSVILDGDSARFGTCGNLDDWKDGVGRLAKDHSRGVFSMSASLAAPLLSRVGLEGGGFHFFGQSSTGKSTWLQAAASVWGRGDNNGLVRTWNSTSNGLEVDAPLHNDVIFALDEVGVADACDVARATYQLAAGQGKRRSTRDAKPSPTRTWTNTLLSTGEVPIANKVEERGGRTMAGQTVRLVDIAADAGKGFGAFDGPGSVQNPKDLADSIKQGACAAYGTAGPAFVSAIINEGVDGVAERIRQDMAAFRQAVVPGGANGQIQRAADRFGIVAAAGELAIALDIVPWPPGHARWAAETCFHDWLAARGGTEPYEVQSAIAQVRRIIEANGGARFERLDGNQDDRPVANQLGYRRRSGPDEQWLVMPEAWKKELTSGFNPIHVAGWLADRGMLLRADDGYQTVVKIKGRAQRFYVLTAALLADPQFSESQP